VRVRQIDKVSELLTRGFKRSTRKVGISNLSLFRMFSVYRDRVPTSLGRSKCLLKSSQPSAQSSIK
jgi:hypothetical protein